MERPDSWIHSPTTAEETWAARLLALGLAVRQRLRQVRTAADGANIEPVAAGAGDLVYPIDRHVEPALVEAIAAWPEDCRPLLLIAEGLGDDGRHRFSGGDGQGYRLLIDPIDGTRGLMYDKRPGWFLAAVAPDRGETTRLSDAIAAVMVELPTVKQGEADAFVAVRGRPALGLRAHLTTDDCRILPMRTSAATTLRHGFAHVVSFFPGTKVFAGGLMERIASSALGPLRPGAAEVFDDQYISTGGQLVELMLGRDRFCVDLRPLFLDILERRSGTVQRGLDCHPYDMAGLLVASQAGVIVTDGFGRPLDAPLDVSTGVHWCGYANEAIRRQVEPVIQHWLAENGVYRPR